MRVRVLFFGQLRDIIGCSEEDFDAPDGATLETVFGHYASAFPAVAALANSVVMARNQAFAAPSEVIEDGDEVAIMPPVSGGSDAVWLASSTEPDGSFFGLTAEPLHAPQLRQRVQQASDGAVITFEGVTRDHTAERRTRYLDYHGYEPLALASMREIGLGAQSRFDIHRVGIVHRVGRVEIAEPSVVIVSASAHRRAAYDASVYMIDTLKKRVPIWKKEYFDDGEVWVEGDWDEELQRRTQRLVAS